MNQDNKQKSLSRAKTLTLWMDARYLDPIIGLFAPGVGDLITAGLSLYLVVLAIQWRLPVVVIARMLLHISLDVLCGAIPVFGDLFDFAYKSNTKNLALLEARYESDSYTATDALIVLGSAGLLVSALLLPLWGAIALLRWLF